MKLYHCKHFSILFHSIKINNLIDIHTIMINYLRAFLITFLVVFLFEYTLTLIMIGTALLLISYI